MKFETDKDEKYVIISNQADLKELCQLLTQRELFAYKFKFAERSLFTTLLESLGIDSVAFGTKYFHFDSTQKLHISESEFGYVWISTYGLIAKSKATKNRAVNACIYQYTVISMLFDTAIKVSQNEKVYDIDSYSFGQLSELTPTIFHNLIFYTEVFCKAYLSITDIEVPHIHKLKLIYQKTAEIMSEKNHHDTIFQIFILEGLYKLVDHVNRIPGGFKEQFVKYDDNDLDDTIIIFETDELLKMKNVLDLSHDFIMDYFYMGEETHYLKKGTYNRMLAKAETEEMKKAVQKMYGHLAKKYNFT